MSVGERRKVSSQERTDAHFKSLLKCPVCGVDALIKYFDCNKRLWVYKHSKLVKLVGGKRKSTVTTYHTADR